MYDALLKNGGGTLKDGKLIEYKTGYQVAISSQEKTFSKLGQLVYFIQKNKLRSVGVWRDGALWFLDTNTKRINTKKEAIELAKKYHQIAIWNWKKSQTVYV
jgi:ribose 5-phosphate isomerase